jgi:replicative DNA helicase
MPSESIVIRMLASLRRIDQTKVRADWTMMTGRDLCSQPLNDHKLFIDDTWYFTSEMRT